MVFIYVYVGSTIIEKNLHFIPFLNDQPMVQLLETNVIGKLLSRMHATNNETVIEDNKLVVMNNLLIFNSGGVVDSYRRVYLPYLHILK